MLSQVLESAEADAKRLDHDLRAQREETEALKVCSRKLVHPSEERGRNRVPQVLYAS